MLKQFISLAYDEFLRYISYKSNELNGVTMKTMTANEAKTHFGELIMKVQGTPITITKNNKPVAVVISMEEYEMIEEMKLATLKARLEVSLRQEQAGELHDGDAVFSDIRAGKFDQC
ncbi:prevent-host-death family protein [Pseudidiomarina donghaiensis]|nr:prevent-host-death family protein [Pseudidiomarina donghaiensis]